MHASMKYSIVFLCKMLELFAAKRKGTPNPCVGTLILGKGWFGGVCELLFHLYEFKVS